MFLIYKERSDAVILAILQARVSSNRLPGKVLRPILGKPMILHQIERIQKSKWINRIILATSTEPEDEPLAQLCEQNGIEVFRGSLKDVLDRYYQALVKYKAKHVVRLTGDCPLIDWTVIDQVIVSHLEQGNDYTGNGRPPTYPDGFDVEAIKFTALETAWREAKLPSEREHVTPYIWGNPEKFSLGNVENVEDLSMIRLTVDEPEDFLLVSQIYEALYPKCPTFTTLDILNFIRKNDLININTKYMRNEGFLKSLQEDSKFSKKGEIYA